VGDDPVDHVALKRSLCVDRLRGQQHLHRHSDAARVDQPHDPAVAVMEAPPRLERSEHRPVRGDAHVARERRLQPARQRPPVDRRDDRFVDPVQPAGEPVEPELGHLAQVGGCGLDELRRDVRLEIRAGAERVSGPGQDRDVNFVVVAEVRPRVDHQPVDVGVDRVLGLGAVDRQVRDPVALLVQQLLHLGPPRLYAALNRRVPLFERPP
jgi:hypothetical protein